MSLSLNFTSQKAELKRLKLPTRYYHFNDDENYVKLLSIGEGIFPKDKINLKISLDSSDCIISTESATKVYPSTKEFGINRFDFRLQNSSNLEYINDELILFKEAKYLQLFTLKTDSSSSFFYADIISSGRSFEHFDFTQMYARNKFIIDGELEYLENFSISGDFLKEYFIRHHSESYVYAKVYVKSEDNIKFEEILRGLGFNSFTLTRSKKMLIGVITQKNIGKIKKMIHTIWTSYREQRNAKPFNLGKQ
ncbi:MAG: urease accessory protein [Sulfurimonas sp.]|jgi:urease accessory protein|uniref:urease accessory protein UreD n=1 Tax=Sulfurimonas sp. TaxID=2022749 RepID=UPI0039E27B70